MEKLHSINYYLNLMTIGCDGCPTMNPLVGSCGIWSLGCSIRKEKETIENLLDEATITFDDFVGLLEYWEYKESEIFEPLPDPIHDEVEFINAFCDDDYDYWLECSQDAMWITKHC